MTLRRSTSTLFAVFLALAGCGNPAVTKSIGSLTGISNARPLAAKPAAGAPQIWLTLTARGIKFPMSLLETRDGVAVYAAKDGGQVFLRNGLLIGTRGYGRDLMSADAPSLAVLRSGQAHQRSYYDMDGTDTMSRHLFTCTVAADPADASHLTEACVADIGTIKNEYWFNSADALSKSRQWLSQGVGYVAIEQKAG